jgi:hypothetical protein
MKWLEFQMGQENFDKAMKEYFRSWQFKHPSLQISKMQCNKDQAKILIRYLHF